MLSVELFGPRVALSGIFATEPKGKLKATVPIGGEAMTAFKPSLPNPPADLSLPTMYDLPSENPEEPGLPDQFHDWQPELLSLTFRPVPFAPDNVLTAADLNLYYDSNNTKYYKRPDWFAVAGVPSLVGGDIRPSYVRWQEGRSPIIVVELLSPNTLEEDQGNTERGRTPPSKWEVYESILQVPYYVLFNRVDDALQLFRLENGRYQEQYGESRLWIPELGIGLGLWQGVDKGLPRQWLRWYDADGNWIPTPEEYQSQRADQERQEKEQERLRADQERQRADQERQEKEQERLRANQARLRAEREGQGRLESIAELEAERQRNALLVEQLRALGVNPDTL